MAATAETKNGMFEKGPGFSSGLRDFSKHLNASTMSAGIVAAIFGCTGPALVVMSAATAGKLTPSQTVSWLFSIYFFGGLVGIVHALYYKQPINGAWSIPGAVMLADALKNFSFNEAVGAYLIAGLLVLILGVTGLIGKIMRAVPIPIVMAMIAGAMIRFGTGIITNVQGSWIIAGAAALAFVISMRINRKIPAALVALVVGVVVGIAMGKVQLAGGDYAFVGPAFQTPAFSTASFFAIAVPLAILVMGAENAQAYGVLLAQGYKPPINAMTIISGIGGLVTGLFGGHNANIAGPMTAICSSEEAGEDKSGRYVATIVNGILFGAFGLIASYALAFVKALPPQLVGVVAGLAMINVLIGSFKDAFAPNRFRLGAFFALVVAMSNMTLLKVSAPFWSLIIGFAISYVLEQKDFAEMKKENGAAA